MASYHNGQGLNESPYVIDLYAQADTIRHGKENPIEPLPTWFRALFLGPSGDFIHLQREVEDLNNWGLAKEVTGFCELNAKATELALQVEVLYKELDLPAMPESCPKSDLFLPGCLKRQPGSRISQGRLVCHTPPSNTREIVNEDISSNWRVMSPALRMPGSYRLPHLM